MKANLDEYLSNYLTANGDERNVIFFTGHSRGAAISNLLGRVYSTLRPQYFDAGDVFCYTFACPNVQLAPDKTLRNIHNYNNPGDCVPEMPLSSWGFGRNGQDHYLTKTGDAFNNFLYQFVKWQDTPYLGTTSTLDFTLPMKTVAGSREEYLEKQFVFKLIAAILAGQSGGMSKVMEYVAKVLDDEIKPSTLLKAALLKIIALGLGTAGVAVTVDLILAEFEENCMKEYDRLDIIMENAKLQAELYLKLKAQAQEQGNEYSFSDFRRYNQYINDAAGAAQIGIETLDDLYTAINILKELLEQILLEMDPLKQMFTMIASSVQAGKDPLSCFFDRIGHAHMPETYAYWMRSMYFGYRGWAGYTADIPLLSIPEKITRVGRECFSGCKGIVEMIVPDSVVKFSWPLEGCTGMKRLTLPVEQLHSGRDTTYGSSYNGYDLNMRDLPILSLRLTPGQTGHMRDTYLYESVPFPSLATLEIDSGVTNIGDRVFRDCAGLKNVTLPDTLREIGNYAFENCDSLETVSIPAGTEKLGACAFSDCANLKTVILPDSIKEISSSCFSGCASLALSPVLPASLETVGESAFSGCSAITEIVFPVCIKKIADKAFYGTSLKHLTVPCTILPQLSTVNYNGSYLYYDLDTLILLPGAQGESQIGDVKVIVRNVILSEGITSIADKSFYEKDLVSVMLPSTLQSIGSRAFEKCENLTSVSLPAGLQMIGDHAFAESGLTQISIPGGVASLGAGAFSGCRSLVSATVGSGITVLPEYLFFGTAMTEVSLPAGLTEIKDCVFSGTPLQSIALPDSLQTLGNFVFGSCDSLETVSLPAGLQEIGDLSYWTGLRRLSFPEGIKEIPHVYNCANLEELAIPASAESYSAGAHDPFFHYTGESGRMFEKCYKLTDIYYAGTETTFPIGINYAFMPHFTVHYRCNMHQHTPGDPVRENEALPTCYRSGRYDEVTYCTVCGKALSHTLVSVDRIAHTPGEPVIENEVAAACAVKGSYEEAVYCTVCGQEISRKVTETETTAHTPGEAVRERELPATCFRAGLYDTAVYCAVCKQELSRNTVTVEKTAHAPGAAVRENERAATCANPGAYDTVVFCTVCKQELSRKTESVEKTAHTPGAPVRENETAPTCAKAGGYQDVIYCAVCRAELDRKTVTIPADANNHASYATWLVNAVSATAAAPGFTGDLVCLGCGSVLERGREIPASGGNNPGPGDPEPLIDTPIAKETAVHTLIVANKTKTQSLLEAIPGAELLKAEGKTADPAATVGSGMTLKKPDGSAITVIVLGDANGDGSVTAADARLALRAAVELETFKPWQTAAVLVGTNKRVTAAEARHILRGAVGLEDPAQWFSAAVR